MSLLNISIIQTSIFWENKRANLEMFQQKIEDLPQEAEFVILPEMFSTGFSMQPAILAETMDGDTLAWMKQISKQHNIVLAGSIIIQKNEKYFNRLICMLPNGNCGYYDKRHLFAYAGEDKNYFAGNKRLIASVKGWKINLQICYDLRFPVWARQQIIETDRNEKIHEYDLLVYVANWPERRNNAWKTLLCARAIENQSYVIGVNRVGKDGNDIYHSGNSMIIDPLGEVLYHKADEEDVFSISLDKNHLQNVREKFPFWENGDKFSIEL